jgi:hypothetical protein
MDDLIDESRKYPELLSKWKLKHKIWGFNPSYGDYLTRGFNFCFIDQNLEYPFNSHKLLYYQQVNQEVINKTDMGSFWFLYYQFPIEGTTMLFLSLAFHSNIIQDVILVNKEEENNKENEKYNFLPLEKNKNIPFYNIYYFNNHIFLFVFENKPLGNYWRANQEGICIPSTNKKDFNTLLECMYENVDKIIPRNIYLESNNVPLFQILNKETPPSKTPIILFFILLFLFFFLLIAATRLWIRQSKSYPSR